MLKVGNLKLVSDTLEQEKSLRGKIKKTPRVPEKSTEAPQSYCGLGSFPGLPGVLRNKEGVSTCLCRVQEYSMVAC